MGRWLQGRALFVSAVVGFAFLAAGRAEAQVGPDESQQIKSFFEKLRGSAYADRASRAVRLPHMPGIDDPKLRKFIENLYRPEAKVGSGSTADAIRRELATGQTVGGKPHVPKGEQAVNGIDNALNPRVAAQKYPQMTAADQDALKLIRGDLDDALRGRKWQGVSRALNSPWAKRGGIALMVGMGALEIAQGKPVGDVVIGTSGAAVTWAVLSSMDALILPALLSLGPVGWVGAVAWIGFKFYASGWIAENLPKWLDGAGEALDDIGDGLKSAAGKIGGFLGLGGGSKTREGVAQKVQAIEKALEK